MYKTDICTLCNILYMLLILYITCRAGAKGNQRACPANRHASPINKLTLLRTAVFVLNFKLWGASVVLLGVSRTLMFCFKLGLTKYIKNRTRKLSVRCLALVECEKRKCKHPFNLNRMGQNLVLINTMKKYNLLYTRGITPKRATSDGVHLR